MNKPRINPPSDNLRDIARFCREVSDRLQSLQLLESVTIQLNETSNGTTAEVKPGLGGGGGDLPVWLP